MPTARLIVPALTALLAFASLLPPLASAQAYRASILHVAPIAQAETSEDSSVAPKSPLAYVARAHAAYEASLLHPEGVEPSIEAAPSAAASDSLTLHPPDIQQLSLQPPLVQPIVIGVLAAFAGAYGGAYAGDGLEGESSSSEYFPVGAAIGYLAGETIALPLGVHFGNARRGNLAGDLGVSLLGHLAAIGLGSLTGSGAVYLVGMAGQIAVTVANERHVGERKARQRAARSAP